MGYEYNFFYSLEQHWVFKDRNDIPFYFYNRNCPIKYYRHYANKINSIPARFMAHSYTKNFI